MRHCGRRPVEPLGWRQEKSEWSEVAIWISFLFLWLFRTLCFHIDFVPQITLIHYIILRIDLEDAAFLENHLYNGKSGGGILGQNTGRGQLSPSWLQDCLMLLENNHEGGGQVKSGCLIRLFAKKQTKGDTIKEIAKGRHHKRNCQWLGYEYNFLDKF